ncbi:Spy/CpxP family protein refolding chaperone [Terracidiphilus gabretensis]|uniref:Spy/CpxP family protein refolding chaperone n=1 Tax=Terracidiphilus gabretensis TaxID=1577687 RepID=UPI00071BBC79|nr:Spy/CpxP family protein refolding chaperone [Terracidiphilus gabretensis]
MMKASLARTMTVAALTLAGVAAVAQAPGSPDGQGFGPGFGGHRPPMERALGPMGSPQGKFWNNPDLVTKLKLTDDQRKGMDQVLQQHMTTLVDLHANLEKSELALQPMMKEDQPNESQILEQIDRVAQARAELEKGNARFLLAIRAKLTPEQWKNLQELRAERMAQFHQQSGAPGMSRHHDGPPQGGPQGAPPTPPQE